MNRAAALRTLFRHAKRPALFAFLHHFQHVRDDFAGTLHQHGVANLHAQPLDFVHVVQRGAADRHAADLHRLEKSHRSERAGAADIHLNVVHHRGFLARRIFVGDGPARSFGGVAQLVLYGNGIYFHHHAVDFVRQFFALVFPAVAIFQDFRDAIAQLPVR